MNTVFYIAGGIAVLSTLMVITRYNMIHSLLYLVVSFLSVAVIFFLLGAPFVAALEVIVYAGAIVVVIIFVIMMLNLEEAGVEQERQWLPTGLFIGPAILAAILLGEIIFIIMEVGPTPAGTTIVDAKEVGLSLYGPYVIGVELSGILLMAGIVGAYHLGRQKKKVVHRFLETKEK